MGTCQNIQHSQQLNTKIQEQARATAEANQKNIKLQGEVDDLKEQLAEKERLFQEKMKELQDDEEKKREELRAELLAALADHRQATVPKANPQYVITSDVVDTPALENNGQKSRKSNVNQSLFQTSKANGPAGTYISTQQLMNVATRRARTRSQQQDHMT
ncbi:uncharacterized protein LOC102721984 [Oryza brachyantha]|uniref:uncharacterized protein LOC102721984 n=1 Tax=Oryza brachyantha TaxID=4533 RepID=UPI000776493F|nr:uncharacterized protein LOC102721984 [Oryza brachyantha]